MPPKSWFQAAGPSASAGGNRLLDDAPTLPGMAAPVASSSSASPIASSAAAGGSARAGAPRRAANVWTGELDSRAEEASRKLLDHAPQLATAPPPTAAAAGGAAGSPAPAAAAADQRPLGPHSKNRKERRPRTDEPTPASPGEGAAATAAAAPPIERDAAPAVAGEAAGTADTAGGARGGRGRGAPRGAPAAAAGAPVAAGAESAAILPYLEVIDDRDPTADILSAEQPRATLQQAEITSVSKKLAQMLRHGALEQGFPITQNGYVPVSAILGHPKFRQVPRSVIAKVTLENNKQRFKMAYGKKDGEIYIRANQGHSMQGIVVDMHRVTDPAEVPFAVHGTRQDVWPKILASGLNRMGRQHVHMAIDVPSSGKVISGARATANCMIYVDIPALVRDGIEVLVSSNGVVLSPGIDGVIPPKYFAKVTDGEGKVMWRPSDATA